MAGTIITDVIQAASTSQLNIKNGVALTPPTIADVNNVEIGTFCRAWVNFNGTGTVAIRASFNVSSITDNGVGTYSVNFTNAMPDANYATNVTAPTSGGVVAGCAEIGSTSLVGVNTRGGNSAAIDCTQVGVSIFR